MKTSLKLVLATLGSAALLGGCASGPYYDNYGYERPYGSGYEYGYSDYTYPTPGAGVGFSYSDRSGRGYRDGDGRWRDRDHDRRDRGEWRDNARDSRDARTNDWNTRNNGGVPLWSQGDTYRGVGPNYDPAKDTGQYSPG